MSAITASEIASSSSFCSKERLESADLNSCSQLPWVKLKVSLNFCFELRFDVRARDDDEGFLLEEFRDFEGEDTFAKASSEAEDTFSVRHNSFRDAFLVGAELDRAREFCGRVDGFVDDFFSKVFDPAEVSTGNA